MTDQSNTRFVHTETELAHPIETVWRAATDSEWLAVWFFPNDIQPVVGHKFTIWSRPIERWDGEFKCTILSVETPHKISFRWYGGHEELKAFGRYMDTVITWTLTPLPNGGTKFDLLHEGFSTERESDNLFNEIKRGSDSVLRGLAKRLPQLIEGGA